MADAGLFQGMFSGIGNTVSSIGSVLLGIIAVAIVGGLVYWLVIRKKKWNLDVEFKFPRSDGRIINAEWGKGSYNAAKGVVYVKRTGKGAVAMRPFDVKRYLQGSNILTVLQVGVEHYEPILPDSFLEVVDDKTGEEGVLLKVKIDTTESKSWKEAFERSTKNAYSIRGFLQEYGAAITIGIVIFLWGIQFLALYSKIKG